MLPRRKPPQVDDMLRLINTALSAAILIYCVSIEHRLTALETLNTAAAQNAARK